jgi:hypothetical protein
MLGILAVYSPGLARLLTCPLTISQRMNLSTLEFQKLVGTSQTMAELMEASTYPEL